MIVWVLACVADIDLNPDNPHAGSWDGDVVAEVDFGFFDDPYCEGPARLDVQPWGEAGLTGECTLMYGPYQGEQLQLTGSGTVLDGAGLTLHLASDERGFEPTSWSGEQPGSIDVSADYVSIDGDVYAGHIFLTLALIPSSP